MAIMGPENHRVSSEEWRRLQDTNFGKNREGQEDLAAATNGGDVDLVRLGAQHALNEAHPYTFREWVRDAIADQSELNALISAYAKHLPEHLLPVRMPGWVYTQSDTNPLKGGPCVYARAFVLLAQEQRVEPDTAALAVYTGISGQPEKVRALNTILRDEFANETNKTLLDYMIDQHKQVKSGLAHSIWDNFPGFKLKEVTSAPEIPVQKTGSEEDTDLRPPEGSYGPVPPMEH